MKIIVKDSIVDLSRTAANYIAAALTLNPKATLGLATGSSPLGIYDELISRYNRGEIDFAQCHTVNLDEYIGLPASHKQSYARYMHEKFFDMVNISKEHINLPNGMATDLETECRRYDSILDELGGIDIQLLGIGHDGHIGFNEPSAYFARRTHCVELAEMTIESNKRFFASKEEVPRMAITMGIQDIMSAKCILLVAYGEDKGAALHEALVGQITPLLPASILQIHPNVVFILDKAAAKFL